MARDEMPDHTIPLELDRIMADKEAVIKADNVVRRFGDRTVLNGISLEIYRGETFVIMGGSGCGKSTFLRHIIGSLKPDSGSIQLLGRDLGALGEDEMDRLRLKIGISFQSSALFDSMTVGENVVLGLKEHTKLAKSVRDIVVKMKLEMVGLRGFEDLMPSQISGGMRKRVGLARAVAMDPEIVFYDEPTAGLDPIVAGVIDKLILDISKKLSITSVVVTHDMKSVFSIADRVAMLYEGKVLEVGTPSEIRNSKNPMVQQFINGSPDGPIRFFRQKDDYLETLVGPG